MKDEHNYLTAREAANELGISLPTLYSYVSRKLIRSQATVGSRARRYWRDDVARLKKHEGHIARSRAIPSGDTAITFISAEGPYYRGRNAITLSETETLESVAALLWNADPAALVDKEPPRFTKEQTLVRQALKRVPLLERVIAILPMVERGNATRYSRGKFTQERIAIDVLRVAAAVVLNADQPSKAAIHELLAERADMAELADTVRRFLVLFADHAYNPSSYAVRAIANQKVSPYFATVAGMVGMAGGGWHRARTEPMRALLERILASDRPDQVVQGSADALALTTLFETCVYSGKDPRAIALMRSMAADIGDDAQFQRLQQAMHAIEQSTGWVLPGLPALFVARKLRYGDNELALVALSRLVGWVAHALEEQQQHPALRITSHYVGHLPPTSDDSFESVSASRVTTNIDKPHQS